jgi:hypothetical protein
MGSFYSMSKAVSNDSQAQVRVAAARYAAVKAKRTDKETGRLFARLIGIYDKAEKLHSAKDSDLLIQKRAFSN